jgi:carbamoyl-phosphate synthase large subunit
MGVGQTFGEAYLKAMLGAGMQLPCTGTVFLSVNDNDKAALLPVAHRLHELGFQILGTRGTALYLFDHGVPAQLIFKVNEGRPNVEDAIRNDRIQLIINTPLVKQSFYDERAIRVAASTRGVPCITTLSAARAIVEAMEEAQKDDLKVYALQD